MSLKRLALVYLWLTPMRAGPGSLEREAPHCARAVRSEAGLLELPVPRAGSGHAWAPQSRSLGAELRGMHDLLAREPQAFLPGRSGRLSRDQEAVMCFLERVRGQAEAEGPSSGQPAPALAHAAAGRALDARGGVPGPMRPASGCVPLAAGEPLRLPVLPGSEELEGQPSIKQQELATVAAELTAINAEAVVKLGVYKRHLFFRPFWKKGLVGPLWLCRNANYEVIAWPVRRRTLLDYWLASDCVAATVTTPVTLADFPPRNHYAVMTTLPATTSSVLPRAGNQTSERQVCFRRSSQVAFGYRKDVEAGRDVQLPSEVPVAGDDIAMGTEEQQDRAIADVDADLPRAKRRPMSASAGGGKPWAAASARSLARRLRRERQAERGWSRAAAMSRRTKALRASLDVHWRLGDAVGCYLPALGEEVAAARLIGCDPALLAEADAALVGLIRCLTGWWLGRSSACLPEGAAPPLRRDAEPFVPAGVRLVSTLLRELGVEQVACNPSVVPPVQGHSHVVVDVGPLRDAAGADDASVSEDSQLVVNLGMSAEDVMDPLVARSAKPLEEVREDPDVQVLMIVIALPSAPRASLLMSVADMVLRMVWPSDMVVVMLIDARAVVHEGDLIVRQLEQIEDSIQSEAHLMECETEVQEAIDQMIDQGLVSVMRPSLGPSRASRLLAASRPAGGEPSEEAALAGPASSARDVPAVGAPRAAAAQVEQPERSSEREGWPRMPRGQGAGSVWVPWRRGAPPCAYRPMAPLEPGGARSDYGRVQVEYGGDLFWASVQTFNDDGTCRVVYEEDGSYEDVSCSRVHAPPEPAGAEAPAPPQGAGGGPPAA
ncbi:unnamed protein product, partial [Prorocentrum cordatum]